MNHRRQLIAPARLVLLVVLSFIAVFSFVTLTKATGTISKGDLTGQWAMTLTGDTGCGISTSYVTFSLNSSGTGTATNTSHTSGCGDSTSTVTFTITSLNSSGSGTANLTCGTACGWNLNIQVSPDRAMFNVVDVSPLNPGNYLEGIAIHQ